MKLHLFQNTDFVCIPQTEALYEPDTNLKSLRTAAEEHGITLNDDEIAVFTNRDMIFSQDETSLAIGAGPHTGELDGDSFHVRTIPEGSYFFYQFADSSKEGITAALQFSLQSLKSKGLTPSSDEIILRGVKEAGFYVYQVLIPVN